MPGAGVRPWPEGKHRWCQPRGPAQPRTWPPSREPLAGRPRISWSHAHQLPWAQSCLGQDKREGSRQFWPQGRCLEGLASSPVSLTVPTSSPTCARVSMPFLTPSTASALPSGAPCHCHSSLLPAQSPPPLLPEGQSPIQRVFEFKAFRFDNER